MAYMFSGSQKASSFVKHLKKRASFFEKLASFLHTVVNEKASSLWKLARFLVKWSPGLFYGRTREAQRSQPLCKGGISCWLYVMMSGKEKKIEKKKKYVKGTDNDTTIIKFISHSRKHSYFCNECSMIMKSVIFEPFSIYVTNVINHFLVHMKTFY